MHLQCLLGFGDRLFYFIFPIFHLLTFMLETGPCYVFHSHPRSRYCIDLIYGTKLVLALTSPFLSLSRTRFARSTPSYPIRA